jgi:hypothetical protein
MRYIIHHRSHGYEAVSAPTTAALAVEAAVALAAAGRVVSVMDETGKPVNLEHLAEHVGRASEC